jgi:hypothetical protein
MEEVIRSRLQVDLGACFFPVRFYERWWMEQRTQIKELAAGGRRIATQSGGSAIFK